MLEMLTCLAIAKMLLLLVWNMRRGNLDAKKDWCRSRKAVGEEDEADGRWGGKSLTTPRGALFVDEGWSNALEEMKCRMMRQKSEMGTYVFDEKEVS